jgi:hypothetical protein
MKTFHVSRGKNYLKKIFIQYRTHTDCEDFTIFLHLLMTFHCMITLCVVFVWKWNDIKWKLNLNKCQRNILCQTQWVTCKSILFSARCLLLPFIFYFMSFTNLYQLLNPLSFVRIFLEQIWRSHKVLSSSCLCISIFIFQSCFSLALFKYTYKL